MKHIFYFLLFAVINFGAFAGDSIRIVILHTNDTHSQVEPESVSDLGGYARRLGMLQTIRSEEKNVLLFDVGDFFQGTPYFNFHNGRVEVDAMNRMLYDAVTIGNHEFDNGIDTLAVVLRDAKFPIVSSNYDMSKTPLKKMVKPYIIIKKFGLKIGVMALNPNPYSLIMQNNYRGLVYSDPMTVAQKTSEFLKKKKRCDLIICLSHLGYNLKTEAADDIKIARNTQYIDVILGGHSHSLLQDTSETNIDGKKVIIGQAGKSGFYLGRINLEIR